MIRYSTITFYLVAIACVSNSKAQEKTAASEKATDKKVDVVAFPFEFTAKDKKFSIRFPAKPAELKQSHKTGVGTIDAKIAIYNAKNESYAVVVSDFPDGHMRANGLDQVLTTAKQGTLKEVSGKLTGEKPFEMDKYKGQDFVISIDDGGKQLHIRQMIVGDRLYQIMVGNSADNSDDSLVEPYMNSFKLSL